MNNIDDKEIEALLRRYRPKGPPDRLRKKLFKPKHSFKTLVWRLSFAAAITLVIGLNFASYRLARQTADLIGVQPLWTTQVEETAHALDGNGWAKKYLLLYLAMEEQHKRSKIQNQGLMGAIQ